MLSGLAFAGAKTYQVTGPVLEVNDSMITVQKGKDRWELDRDSNTIEVFVGRLRKKLGIDVLHTIRGMGYRVSEPDNAV